MKKLKSKKRAEIREISFASSPPLSSPSTSPSPSPSPSSSPSSSSTTTPSASSPSSPPAPSSPSPFVDQVIEKVYLVGVSGRPPQESGFIKGGISKSKNHTKYCLVKKGGDPVLTRFTLLRWFEHSNFGKVSVMSLDLVTGRRHQLRVTSGYMGCPIIGDTKYNGKKFDTVLLHSAFIKFPAMRSNPIGQYHVFCFPDHWPNEFKSDYDWWFSPNRHLNKPSASFSS
eukprot:TRINITY_DN5772_c0_g1_i1.p1 TRINITY_DN5772_c0_g1~~TRINITY_DN5772_c0_g1_i1.p1  ORF type:complete len:227 (-),score=78.74 TRINITY_DN5772_c0_g1_i1:26-706(-)